jgi:hypothetical protein
MPLQLSKDDSYGNTHSAAHIVIRNVHINYVDNTATVDVLFYKDAASEAAGKAPFQAGIYDIVLTEGLKNSIRGQIQTELLLLAEFSGAIEV